jgi:hypothetical protein
VENTGALGPKTARNRTGAVAGASAAAQRAPVPALHLLLTVNDLPIGGTRCCPDRPAQRAGVRSPSDEWYRRALASIEMWTGRVVGPTLMPGIALGGRKEFSVRGKHDRRDGKDVFLRLRASASVTAATLAALALGGGVGMSASTPVPILRTFALNRSVVASSGGVIRITVRSTQATSCVITSSPGVHGLPKVVSCKRAAASVFLSVPSNRTTVTRRFHLAARAVRRQISSPPTYLWLAQPPTPRVTTCIGRTVIGPAYYVIACGDGNAWWQKVTWARWGASTAVGHGQIVINDCTPFCFSGHFHAYPLTVRVSHLRATPKSGVLYERYTLSYSIQGKHVTDSENFPTTFVAD